MEKAKARGIGKAKARGIGKVKVKEKDPDIPSQENAGDAAKLAIANSSAQKERARPRATVPRTNGRATVPRASRRWFRSTSLGVQPAPGIQPAGSPRKEDLTPTSSTTSSHHSPWSPGQL